MSDTIDRDEAIRLVHGVLYEMMVESASKDIDEPMKPEDRLLLKVNKAVCATLREMPSAEPERARKDCRNCKHGNYNDHWGTFFCYHSGDCNDWDKWEPSAEPEIAENLYLYKCYITDKDGLQHEVIHTGDIRRVTGWEI